MTNILITGASQGIGAAIVKQFSKQSAITVFALARNEYKLNELASTCNRSSNGSRVIPVNVDLDNADYHLLIKRILLYSETIDVVIHNAGSMVNKPFESIIQDDFETAFSTNVKVPFFLTQALLPLLKAGSHILAVSSMGGVQGSQKYPGLSVYSAAKGALAVLMESLAAELSDRKISFNALALGSVQTEMLQKAFPGYQAPVDPAGMAEFIAWFALNGCKVMNGKILPVALSNP